MKLRFLAVLCALVTTGGVAATSSAAQSSSRAEPVFYVSLGDSLAAGTQPGQFSTNEGYADQLWAGLRATILNLQLVKLGCPGESTATMIDGSIPYEGRGPHALCPYPEGSQLGTAAAFLHSHRQSVRLVTIDLGANDALSGGGVPAIVANLPRILATLREAAGPGIPIIGMNYYDSGLAVWFTNPTALPGEIAGIVAFNNVLEGLYAAAGDPVADVETAFSTTVTTPVGGTPLDVLRVCQWTWICTPAQDIHANAVGYGVIAHAFRAAFAP